MREIGGMLLLLFLGTSVLAQGDSIQYIRGLPVTEDTVTDFPGRDLPPNTRRITAMPVRELPDDLVESLDRGDAYTGWRDTIVYFDPDTKLYVLPLPYERGVRIFRLNARGKPVAYDDVAAPDRR